MLLSPEQAANSRKPAESANNEIFLQAGLEKALDSRQLPQTGLVGVADAGLGTAEFCAGLALDMASSLVQ